MPTQWADFGKKTKDLLTKKYDFKNELKTINKTQDGVNIETGVCGSTAQGYMKVSCKRDFGEVEAEIHSNPEAGDKAKVKFDKLVDKHLAVTVNASSAATVGVETTFEKDRFAGKLDLNHSEKATKATISAAVGLNKELTVGASADIDATHGNFALKDYNAGVEGRHKDVTAAVKTSRNRQDVTLSIFHKFASNLQWGANVVVHPQDGFSPVLTLGCEHELSTVTTIKSRGTTDGALGFVVEQKLKNPSLKLNLAAEFDVAKSFNGPAKKFGLSLVFGDY
jgi:hypothetical protein